METRTDGCVFCAADWHRDASLVLANSHCVYATSRDPRDPLDVMPFGGVIVPRAHRGSPFDLTVDEWLATRSLLVEVRRELHSRIAPDGYTLGWNDQSGLHAHLHVVPRFEDEPCWGTAGVRSAIKVHDNVRPSPFAPGGGKAMSRAAG